MSLRGLSSRRVRRSWGFAAALAALAEFHAWQGCSASQRQWLWILLGLCTLTAAWFWREYLVLSTPRGAKAQSHVEDEHTDALHVDPALAAIREIWMSQGVPRIVVDAKHEGVVVPSHVRDRWGHQLIIDLDPRYPLRLEVNYQGCAVDLSFAGEVSRCTFAWPSIYTVQNRSSGEAVVIESRIPKEVATRS